jgi:3-deoxy-D-manno-octulosonate 8-phosphate phosphatase (KDO 8-P phosphatase)
MLSDPDLQQKIEHIQILLLDVDGVLTDGRIIYHDTGDETKVFHVRDGLGIRLLAMAGIRVGIATGRASSALQHRCRNLGITLIFDGLKDKVPVLEQIFRETGISAENIAFVGDDLPDLGIMKRVGMAIAVADAHDMIIQQADWVASCKGGQGAVREVCELILKKKGLWNRAVQHFSG